MQDAESSEKKDTRTVEEVFQLDEDHLHIMTDQGSYWEKCQEFYEEIKGEVYEDLSNKQKNWLKKIKRALDEDNCQ